MNYLTVYSYHVLVDSERKIKCVDTDKSGCSPERFVLRIFHPFWYWKVVCYWFHRHCTCVGRTTKIFFLLCC